MRGAAIRPPLTAGFFPTLSGLGSGTLSTVDHALGFAPECADVLGDHDRRRGGNGTDDRERDAVLGQILAGVIGGQFLHKRCHVSSFLGSPPSSLPRVSLRVGPL